MNVLVTGAGHGIGAALARRFADAGHAVAALDRDGEAASDVAKRIEDSGGRALALQCDVSVPADAGPGVRRVIEAWGGIDVLVNNAGITHVGRAAETDAAVLRKVMDVNFFGAVHCTQAALPSLLERRGVVAVLSSVAGFAPLATRSGYVASKHALQGYFATLRTEHAADGLTVTIVCPSFVATGIGRRALAPDGGPADEGARTGVAHVTSPEAAADAIFRGIERRRRLVLVGAEARLAYWVARFAPRLYERAMVRRATG